MCRLPKNQSNSRRFSKRRRVGSTLLDVALGASVLAILLVPSMHLVSQHEQIATRTQLRERLLYEADRILQEQRILLRDRQVLNDAFGSPAETLTKLSIDSFPNCLTKISWVPELNVGSKSTPLVTVIVDVWQDRNGNQTADSDEPFQSLRTHQGEW